MFIIQRMVNIAIRVNSCVSERVFVHRRPGVATAMTIAATDTMNKAAVSNLWYRWIFNIDNDINLTFKPKCNKKIQVLNI